MRIARAASRMIAYDNGFLYEFGTTTILRWDANVTKMINEGVDSTDIVTNNYKAKINYVTQIETAHPGYIHYLYRKATHIRGPKAGFAEIALQMVMNSAVSSEIRPSLELSRWKVNKWFLANE